MVSGLGPPSSAAADFGATAFAFLLVYDALRRIARSWHAEP